MTTISILLIEDSRTDAEFATAVLERAEDADFRVTHVTTLASGLELLASTTFDAVLLDLTLPDSEGEDSFVRVLSEHPEVPLVVITGTGSEEIGMRAVNRGAQDYLVKWTVDTIGIPRAIRFAIERRNALERMRELAMRDQLTGLPNRALLNDRLEHAVESAVRAASPVAVLFLDLDGFKAVNDDLGHAAGDLVLIEVGQRLQSTVRTEDTVGRLGGDEFVVIVERAKAVEELANRLVAAVEQPIRIGEHHVQVGASLGIAVTEGGQSTDWQALLERADSAMYESKRLGGGQVHASTDRPR